MTVVSGMSIDRKSASSEAGGEGDETVDVTIVMPCLNESLTLPYCIGIAQETLDTLREAHGFTGEILISDNGSTDGSQEIAQDLGARVVHCPEKGYGNALIHGVKSARGRMIVMGDSDGSYDFREAVPMVGKLVEGYDLCMGTRLKGEIKPGAMPWKNRYIGNPALTGILNLFFRSNLSDAHCGLRAFTKDAAERMNLASPGMEFASEIVVKAALLDLRRTELPITLHPDRRERAPHLRPWRDGWRHLRYLVMLTPVWLYFLPAVLLATLSALLLAALLLHPEGSMVEIGPMRFGDHWMILAGSFGTVSHLAFLMGLTATLVGLKERYRRLTPPLRMLYKLSRLEVMVAIGSALCFAGALLMSYILIRWGANSFHELRMMREMVLATLLITLGLQNVFGGFLLSIVAGNQPELSQDKFLAS